MIGTEHLQTIVGSNAVDSDGDKIGKVGHVYLDDHTGEPGVGHGQHRSVRHEGVLRPARQPASRATSCVVPYDKA